MTPEILPQMFSSDEFCNNTLPASVQTLSSHLAADWRQCQLLWNEKSPLMQAGAPIMHLRNMNAHVASALGEWSKAQDTLAHVPLQAAPAHNSTSSITFAGPVPHKRLLCKQASCFEMSNKMLSFSDCSLTSRYKLLWHEWCQRTRDLSKRAHTPSSS